MAKLVEKYIEIAAQKNPGEPEFLQTVEEVLSSFGQHFEQQIDVRLSCIIVCASSGLVRFPQITQV